MRESITFPPGGSPIDSAIQETLRVLLPTVVLENFAKARDRARAIVPKRRLVILNSQHMDGREMVDFFIAHSVEEQKSHHVMVCHGGCYGAMEVSVQEQVWAQISDSYALWSNPKSFGGGCNVVKLPSLRFNHWQKFKRGERAGGDILMFMTGHYPNRYAYNSIYPYTIDQSYDDWQIRFLTALSEKSRRSVVIRDYHRSMEVGQATVQSWALSRGIRIDASQPMAGALRQSRIAVQTVPQTTYLETISADHPTICYWNPDANMIRDDLKPFYDGLVDAGVLHYSPESAAQKLEEVADDPLAWWKSPRVARAIEAFKANVCLTAPDAIDQWGRFIKAL